MSKRSFTSIPTCHTHTLPLAGWCHGKWGEDEDEGGMKVRWTWKWDERLLNQNAKRGTQKKRERTHTNTPGPKRANPERAREEKSGGPTDTEQDQRRGARREDGSAWTNLTQRKPTQTSARDGPDLPGEGRTHEIGDQWGTSWWKKKTNTKN